MKIFHIARKDIVRAFRSAMFLVFGLALPLFTTLIFYFAFGGLDSGGEGFTLPTVDVEVVNQDQTLGTENFGALIVEFLRSDELSEQLNVSVASSVEGARQAVDRQEADVAVIIPQDFTATVFSEEGSTSIEVYQDPTLTIGPSIVKDIVRGFVDSFAGTKIAASVAYQQLAEQGVSLSEREVSQIAQRYAEWSAAVGHTQDETTPFLDVRSPSGETAEPADVQGQMIRAIMTGMMIFYSFFTGASMSQSILQEEEEGTLSRLFTTPTAQSQILGGKFISIFVALILQVLVLIAAASLVFGIEWGRPLPLGLAILSLILLAPTFGLFVTSLLESTRQAGAVYGGVLTVAGMVGISSTFTQGLPTDAAASQITNTVSLLVPQGWAMRIWTQLFNGRSISEMLITLGVILALSVGFFVWATFNFNRRFS